jgi:hypothetical protein
MFLSRQDVDLRTVPVGNRSAIGRAAIESML